MAEGSQRRPLKRAAGMYPVPGTMSGHGLQALCLQALCVQSHAWAKPDKKLCVEALELCWEVLKGSEGPIGPVTGNF